MPAPLPAGLRPFAGRRRLVLASSLVATALCCSAAPALAAQPAGFSAGSGSATVSAARPGALPPGAGPHTYGVARGPLAAEDHDRLRDSGVVADVPSDVPAPPELPATSYLLADLGSGDVLVGKAAHESHLSASTMKLLTAQTLMPRLDDGTKIRATNSDASVDGTRVGMVPGREYTADQLFHALLMGSANDAAEALARGNGGLDESLKQMSERAAQLGAKDTVPKTPHGLDAPGQQTTAYDLVAILRGALDTPKVAQILATQTYPFPKYQPLDTPASESSAAPPSSAAPDAAPSAAAGGSLAGTQQVASQNKLLWNYEGTIGGKDGYTDAAGHTYVGAVRRGDKTYAVAFMGAKSNDWRPTAGLLDWAFANGAKAKPIGKLPNPAAPIAVPAGAAGLAGAAAGLASGEAAQEGGLVATVVGFILTLLKILLWTVLILAVAVVGLRIRKVRRDARRREERRRRIEASRQGAVRPDHPRTRPPHLTSVAVPAPRSTSSYQATTYDMAADGTVPYPGTTPDADDPWAVHRLDERPGSGPVQTQARV